MIRVIIADDHTVVRRGLTEILNEAYGQDPEFFDFFRTMQAYSAALASDSTYMVLSPDSEFFSFFGGAGGPAVQPAQ